MDVKRWCLRHRLRRILGNVLAIDTAVRRDDEQTVLRLLGTPGSAPDWVWALQVSAYPPLLNGDASVMFYAASTAVERFHPRLRVVDPGGTSVNLQEGILRARYRNSVSEPELMSPGKVYEFTIDLGPIGAPVHGGSSLRLDISSSDFPSWDRNLNTGGQPLTDGPIASTPATQTVFHDSVRASCIHLLIERA